jgi:hypothetical protein
VAGVVPWPLPDRPLSINFLSVTTTFSTFYQI